MLHVGLDLANTTTGAAAVRLHGDHVELVWLRPLHLPDDAKRAAAKVLAACSTADAVSIERPPDVVRGHVRHGPQARLGYALGRICGRIEAGLDATGIPHELVEVRDWRATMLERSANWGVPAFAPGKGPALTTASLPLLAAPRAVREGTTVYLVWPCGHRRLFDPARARSADTMCRQCGHRDTKPLSRAEVVTAEWKATACRLVRARWPELYAELVADARERARTPRADHELSGVADACEAAFIAVHGVRQAAARVAA